MPEGHRPRQTATRSRLAGPAALVVVASILAVGCLADGTEAPFTARTGQPASTFSTGTIAIRTDLASTVLFDVDTRLTPGQTIQRCVRAEYEGSVEAAVKLYAAAATDLEGLGSALRVTVEEGTGAAEDRMCSAFTPTSTLLDNRNVAEVLAAHTTYSTGLSSWTPSFPQSRSYRFIVTFPAGSSDHLQGALLRATVAWDARST